MEDPFYHDTELMLHSFYKIIHGLEIQQILEHLNKKIRIHEIHICKNLTFQCLVKH